MARSLYSRHLLQRWCFDQDFQRLGPSIYRVLEARLLGLQKMKHSPTPRGF